MNQDLPTEPASTSNEALAAPALRTAVKDFVRRRVPASDVEDVVQNVFCDAIASADRPRDPKMLPRWLVGIAKHKVADWHRKAGRERPADLSNLGQQPPPFEARALARWAESQAKGDGKTLGWMAREGDGEKLEAIAAEEKVSAAKVRQRVSRMRRWMKERWAAELAAATLVVVAALAAWWVLHQRGEPPVTRDLPGPAPNIVPEPPSPLERARVLRADALRACERSDWAACLDGLDKARSLDPTGEQDPDVASARAGAEDALRRQAPEPKPRSSATSAPTAPPAPTSMTTASTPFDEEKKPPSKARGKPAFEDLGSKEATPGTMTGKGSTGKVSPKKGAPSKEEK
jgi:DNA-directed RNA polymerase specialized sigma24 family protein